MILWFKKLVGFVDRDFNPERLSGLCSVIVARDRFLGIPVICGRRTNSHYWDEAYVLHWRCQKHAELRRVDRGRLLGGASEGREPAIKIDSRR
jgi:hypothetical protein